MTSPIMTCICCVDIICLEHNLFNFKMCIHNSKMSPFMKVRMTKIQETRKTLINFVGTYKTVAYHKVPNGWGILMIILGWQVCQNIFL